MFEYGHDHCWAMKTDTVVNVIYNRSFSVFEYKPMESSLNYLFSAVFVYTNPSHQQDTLLIQILIKQISYWLPKDLNVNRVV